MRKTLIAIALALSACTIEPNARPNDPPPDLVVDGAKVYTSAAPADSWARRSDLAERLHAVLAASVATWGCDLTALDDALIHFGDWSVCDGAGGCELTTDGRAVISISVYASPIGDVAYCVEASELIHEIGHACIGDPAHIDPRWKTYPEVTSSLVAGRADCGALP